MSGTIEKVKNALHLNKDHTTSTTHNTTTHTGNGVPEGTAGPHGSRVANAADPRVDSDLDSSRTGTVGTGAVGTHTTHTGTHGTHNTTTTSGPHNSNLLNKADPRVDSDRDGSHNYGAATGTTGASAYTSNTHTGPTTHTGTHNTTTTSGPHNSNLLNKADPRVDSDRDGSRNLGAATGNTGASAYTSNTSTTHGTHTGAGLGSTGTAGGISHSTNAGPHNSNLANKADPRVDSDLDGSGNRHAHGNNHSGILGASGSHATPGSGTAQNTAGPHNSDLANKLDPRVDADLDGSKTYGGNKTHA